MSDHQVGNYTNLCRSRGIHLVRNGVVTKTGPYIPVSLGFSCIGSSDSWENLGDENGCSTGMEWKSIRLKIVDGRTE